MAAIGTRHAEREAERLQASRAELVERIMRTAPDDGLVEPMTGVRLHRASAPSVLGHGVSSPALCVIAQGSKETMVGGERYRYDPANYLITTAMLPVTGRIIEASAEHPYLSLMLQFDPALVGSVMVEAGREASRGDGDVRAINVSRLDADLLEAVLRLIRLVDASRDARIVGPLVTREIVYRLLTGEQGARLRHTAMVGGSENRITRAIEHLKSDFDQPLRIEHLARDLGMSVSGFHKHFKAVTAMSPLQFQKRLRLQEARQLMLAEGYDAATAGYRVGYDDASHFSREYRRMFGEPPMRDITRLRATAPDLAAAP